MSRAGEQRRITLSACQSGSGAVRVEPTKGTPKRKNTGFLHHTNVKRPVPELHLALIGKELAVSEQIGVLLTGM